MPKAGSVFPQAALKFPEVPMSPERPGLELSPESARDDGDSLSDAGTDLSNFPPVHQSSNRHGIVADVTPLDGNGLNGAVVSVKHALSPTLRCLHRDCEASKATYRRRSDLNRHKMSHDGSNLNCTAVGCNRKKGFSRKDKLREHIRRAHGYEGYFECPFGCEIEPLPFVLFVVHMVFCHRTYCSTSGWEHLYDGPFCPLKSCGKPLKNTTLLHKHISGNHSERDRSSQISSLLAAGFDALSCCIICPLCGDTFDDVKNSAVHIFRSHLVDEDHFMAYFTAVIAKRKQKGMNEILVAGFISDYLYGKLLVAQDGVTCPRCLYFTDVTFPFVGH